MRLHSTGCGNELLIRALGLAWLLFSCAARAEVQSAKDEFRDRVQPILKEYCITCHSTEKQKGDLDLERFHELADVKADPVVWEHALEQIRDKEMPPRDKPKPTPEQFQVLTHWLQGTLDEIAFASAGDPGPVILRRLSNMEYTYSVRDLTGVATLDPAKEFPVDGAAGEGFTNVGAALVMSPSLLGKYLDAAKNVASHAVLAPEGIWFSESVSTRDWTNEILAKIRAFYSRFSTDGAATEVEQQGIKLNTGSGGRLPLAKYLAAVQGKGSATGLSTRYLETLRAALDGKQQSQLLDTLRAKYATGTLQASDIEPWQQSLWKLNSIGHLGKVDGPKSWMEPVTPLTAKHEIKLKLAPPADGGDLTLYLSTSDAGDGNAQDFALWEDARLVVAGRPDLRLRDVRAALQQLAARRLEVIASLESCLAAAHEAEFEKSRTDVAKLAVKHGVSEALLTDWLRYLGIGTAGEVNLGPLLTKKMESTPDYNFVKSWKGDGAFSIQANSSDQTVRLPGTMKPHSIAVHPSAKLAAIIAWKSPIEGMLQISGSVQDVHTGCGNGITWELQLRKGNTWETLARGESDGAKLVELGKHEGIQVRKGDAIAMVIGPKNGDHACDLTGIELSISDGKTEWNAAKELSPNILAGNPHADSHGNKDVWHFFGEPDQPRVSGVIPQGSLLSEWRRSKDAVVRAEIAQQLRTLLQKETSTLAPSSPEKALYAQMLALNGPLLGSILYSAPTVDDGSPSPHGLDPSCFGKHPIGEVVPPSALCVQAPNLIEVRLPAQLIEGAEFVVTGRLHPKSGAEASVQMQATTTRPSQQAGLQYTASKAQTQSGAWTNSATTVAFQTPILVHDASPARARFEAAFADFRKLFPAALCYTKIVPSDEVVTLTLFHREDHALSELMLDADQKNQIDRLWAELHFVSQDALTSVDAFEQIWQFSTQDGPDKPNGDKRLAPLRDPILKVAAAFKQRLVETEPVHVQAALDFAARAWRRPLAAKEQVELRSLYQKLRKEGIPHAESIKMLLARTLVAPAFLYRGERPLPGLKAAPVNAWELATRLSYFLWSGPPDEALLEAARSGTLNDPRVLFEQTQRMLKDGRVRRLATEFGCQWLHIRDIETLEEKSERHFPSFKTVRGAMQEEAVRFFMELFTENRSVLSLLDADHTFVNGTLAAHYGIAVEREDWQRVEGLREMGRGGILGFASTLAKQSGASRTSPILRGNWLSEVVLGDKLPRPPKGVPLLPEEAPKGLTERELIEKHSSDAVCANCHKRIDPFGFALEGFDAIGRARNSDSAGLPIDTHTTLPDGTPIVGLVGLREALLSQRSDDFLRQFCRKLLGYALGRSVRLSDKPLITEMVNELKTQECKVESAFRLIVTSPQFREVRGKDFASVSDH